MTSKKEIAKLKTEISSINKGVSIAFKTVKSELNEHLNTINLNSSELSYLIQMVSNLEEKIDKLNERIDEFSISKINLKPLATKTTLNNYERDVFITLYTSENFLSVKEIARTIAHTQKNTNLIITKLISKEIPIIKQVKNNKVTYALDRNFKRLQATQNIISLS